MTTRSWRPAVPLVALVAGVATACTSSGTVGAGSTPPKGSAASSGAPVASASGDDAFCSTFKARASTIQNAGSDPTSAADTFDTLLMVAPAAIKADVKYVDDALHAGLAGTSADLTKVTAASTRVTKYYVSNCS